MAVDVDEGEDGEVVGTIHLHHKRTDMVIHSRTLGKIDWTFQPCKRVFSEPWVELILDQGDEGVHQDWARQLQAGITSWRGDWTRLSFEAFSRARPQQMQTEAWMLLFPGWNEKPLFQVARR